MEQYIEFIGTIVGLAYIWLEYRASIYLWIAGIIMPAIYIYVYYNAGLYADFCINIYYLIIAFYGWIAWKTSFSITGRKKKPKELPITYMPSSDAYKGIAIYIVSQLFIAWVLVKYTNSNVVWADSFTTALSIVGMWMLARKYIEQWWVWFVVDIVSSGLYVYKELYFTAILYLLYAIIAIFGYFKWKRMMQYEA